MVILAPKPNPYAATLDVIHGLPARIIEARAQRHLTPKAQAKQIGISTSTLTALTAGHRPTYTTLVAALRWLSTH